MENVDFYRQETLPNVVTKPEKPSPIPQKIGPYKIDTLLHKGSMSMLFLGTHPSTKEVLAIKILSPSLQTNEPLVAQFLEEAKMIHLADHPNIVKLYGQGEWEKGLYIAMEFIRGVSLRQFIEGGSLSLKRSLDIILQVAYALLHLHTHGIIHRDLKPENILMTEKGQVKVIDFGIARLVESKQTPIRSIGGIIGTPNYMSPEQKKNPESASFTSDIYSLGVIAYELIMGRLSFGNIQLDLLPKPLKEIIQKALAEDPKNRYQDIVDFITAISAYLKKAPLAEDKMGRQDLKEVWDSLGQQHNQLLPQSVPNWPEVEIGLAKPTGVYLFGTYYDFFRLSDGSLAIILAESKEGTISHFASITTLRGIVRALIQRYTQPNEQLGFVTSHFAYKLNQVFANEPHMQSQAITILHLSPFLNEFSFVSSGFESIWHLSSQSRKARILKNESPMLGSMPGSDFYATNDRWNDGDIILMHSFGAKFVEGANHREMDEKTRIFLEKNCHLSSQKLAELALSSLNTSEAETTTKNIVFTLTRID